MQGHFLLRANGTLAFSFDNINAYDPEAGLWAIWWIDGRNPHGALDAQGQWPLHPWRRNFLRG